jgi:hypothetical protein
VFVIVDPASTAKLAAVLPSGTGAVAALAPDAMSMSAATATASAWLWPVNSTARPLDFPTCPSTSSRHPRMDTLHGVAQKAAIRSKGEFKILL